jgi:hypothetical protein
LSASVRVGTFFDAVREERLGVAGVLVTGFYGDIDRGVRGALSPFEAFELAGILALPAAGARFDPTVARMFGGRGTTNEYADRAMTAQRRFEIRVCRLKTFGAQRQGSFRMLLLRSFRMGGRFTRCQMPRR